MEKPPVLKMLRTIAISVFLNSGLPLLAEINSANNSNTTNAVSETHSNNGNSIDLLNQAHTLLREAANLAGNDKNSDQRKELLIQASDLIRQVPRNKAVFQGHKRKAFLDIRAALLEIKNNSDNQHIVDRIRKADIELCTAITLGQKK